jgi:hypothetical protein
MKSTYITDETGVYVSTSGGEAHIGDTEIAEYGIEIGDISIGGIGADDFCKLAVIMINHARLNGRKFVFCPDHNSQDQPIKLEYRGK